MQRVQRVEGSGGQLPLRRRLYIPYPVHYSLPYSFGVSLGSLYHVAPLIYTTWIIRLPRKKPHAEGTMLWSNEAVG
jgi:hypothetical protein